MAINKGLLTTYQGIIANLSGILERLQAEDAQSKAEAYTAGIDATAALLSALDAITAPPAPPAAKKRARRQRARQ